MKPVILFSFLLIICSLLILHTNCAPKERDHANPLDPEYSNPNNSSNDEGYTLVWSDEFNGIGSPNSSNWLYDIGVGNWGWGNNESEYYTARQENIKQSNGSLIITARHEVYGGRSYTSARIKTQGKHSWKYGRIEAKIKLPANDSGVTDPGVWPAFWTLGNDIGSKGWPACGEIDVMEFGGAQLNKIHCYYHWANSGGYENISGRSYTASDCLDGYHVFRLDWDSEYLRTYYDDNLVTSQSIAGNNLTEFHQPHFILLNLAIEGNFVPSGTAIPANYPQRMYIDWIRVYQKD